MDELLRFTPLIEPLVLIIVTVVGWGVHAIWSKVCGFDKKIDEVRLEIHTELQEYQRKEMCRTHREYIERKIADIARIYGISRTESGMGIVDINNVQQMKDLYNAMTPAERSAHLARCQFAEKGNGVNR